MESQRVLRQIIKEHDLYDIWRVLNKTQRQYTWTQVREYHVTMARLDRWYCFKHHFNTIKCCEISPVGFSDHCLVCCNVFINNVKPRIAYWHLLVYCKIILFVRCLIFFGKMLRIQSHLLILCSNGGIMEKYRYSNCAVCILSILLETLPDRWKI